jgi:hypothetical protein
MSSLAQCRAHIGLWLLGILQIIKSHRKVDCCICFLLACFAVIALLCWNKIETNVEYLILKYKTERITYTSCLILQSITVW